MSRSYKPLFIVGYPRSGTTWTMWLLSQHSEVVASFHGGFFHALANTISWRQTPGNFGKFIVPNLNRENLNSVSQAEQRIDWMTALPQDIFNKQLREMAHEFFDAIAAQGQTPSVVIENTPENLEFLSWILDMMPEAYILHVIRDPRSIWSSIHKAMKSWLKPNMEGAFPPTLAKNSALWCDYMQMGRDLEKRTSQYTEVRYEALKSDGPTELARLFDWLDLPVDSNFCEQALANSAMDKMKKELPSPQGFFGKGQSTSWKDTLANSEIKQIEYLAGDWMEKLGYKRHFPIQTNRPWQLTISDFKSRIARFLRRRIPYW